MRRTRATAALALLLTGCSPATTAPSASSPGLVVITAGGTALVDGQSDVPPTLDLRISTSQQLSAGSVHATLDDRPLALTAAQGGLTATVPAMPLGSAHALSLDVPGRGAQRLQFHVVPPAGAQAAVHSDSRDGTVLDVAFQFAPDRPAVEAALPSGGAPAWPDDRHLRASWPSTSPSAFALDASLTTARGSHLAGPLHIALDPPPASTVRRTTVPAAPAAPKAPLVVAFTVGTAASRASLAAHADRISMASPTGLHIAADGSVTGEPGAPAVTAAAAHALPVWPLIQNDASDSAGIARILEDGAASQRLVSTAVDAAKAGGFPGLHLDVEGVPEADRDHLSALVGSLAGALHGTGRKLAVAVVPHKPGHLNVYSAAYDLKAISGSADLVTLMAYDEHTSLTGPGAVAGYTWDQQLLAGSLAEVRSTSTSLLGLPLYARSWRGTDVTADSYAASVSQALASPGARVDYDFAAATPYIHQGDDPTSTTWFDDAQSLAQKLSLVDTLELHGIALWRLGFEDPALWTVLPQNPPRP